MGLESRATRRTVVFGGVSAVLLAGCAEQQAPMLIKPTEQPKPREQEAIFKPGDVLQTGKMFYLFRNDAMYSLTPEEFNIYRRLSKLDQYGRKIIPSSSSDITKHEVREVRKATDRRGVYIDPFTGHVKNIKPLGGEINVYIPGFTDDDGVPYTTIRPVDDTFKTVRKDLESNKWGTGDSFFYTYGRRGYAEYSSVDTAKHPSINKSHAREFINTIAQDMPFVQVNILGYSLGGFWGREMAQERPDVVNNLIFLSSPLRGLNPIWERKMATATVKAMLRARYGITEEVTDYLFDIYENKEYQKQLDEWAATFVGSGRKIVSLLAGDDPVVPVESGKLKGVTTLIGEEKTYDARNITQIPTALSLHGKVLKDPVSLKTIGDMVGENLAA